jgi:hypothetical protein
MTQPVYPPDLVPLRGADRAQPYAWPNDMPSARVVGYYLPSPYADVPWTMYQARVIPLLQDGLPVYPLPIYVASMALTVGDGTKYADEAIALCRVYPNHSVVVLDIEEEAESTTPQAVAALDIQEQVAREFIAEVYEGSELVPVIYGSMALYGRILNNFWVAYWLEIGDRLNPLNGCAQYPRTDPLPNGNPRPVGWQYLGVTSGDTKPDLSVWLPFLFSKPEHLQGGWANMQRYVTKEDDTLQTISTELYGDTNQAQRIFTMNLRSLRRYGPRNAIPEGTVLSVPSATVKAASDDAATELDANTVAAPPVDPVLTPAPPVAPVLPTVSPVDTGPTPTTPEDFKERAEALLKEYATELEGYIDTELAAHRAQILAVAVKALSGTLTKV